MNVILKIWFHFITETPWELLCWPYLFKCIFRKAQSSLHYLKAQKATELIAMKGKSKLKRKLKLIFFHVIKLF